MHNSKSMINLAIITPGPVFRIKEEYCRLMIREFNINHLSMVYSDYNFSKNLFSNYDFHFSKYNYKHDFLCKVWFGFHCMLHFFIWRLKNRKIDIISAYDPLKTGLIAYICSKIMGIKFVVEVNGVYNKAIDLENNRRIWDVVKNFSVPLIQKFVLKRANGVKLLFSHQIEDLNINKNNKHIDVFPNYVNIKHFLRCDHSNEKNQILFAGFPFWIKGVDILISAFKIIAGKYNDWELKILGHYPDKSIINSFAGNHARIFVHDAVMPDQMPFHMKECAIFVLPSRTEALGRVLIEAMAAGKPRIGSDVDGIPSVIRNGIDGLLFKPGNVDDLADKMKLLITNSKLRRKMGEEGRKRVMNDFTEENYVKNLRNFYDRIVV